MFGRTKPLYADAEPLIDGIQRSLGAEVSVTDLNWLYEAEPET
ncbi:hypothetical protein BH24DEI2_BH24DEI2_28260 [soil metagenome]